jgi:hypothetical protein
MTMNDIVVIGGSDAGISTALRAQECAPQTNVTVASDSAETLISPPRCERAVYSCCSAVG